MNYAASFFLLALPACAESPAPPVKTVFLMHGILESRISMTRIERALQKRGFKTVNLGYPSRSKTVEEHARWLAGRVEAEGAGDIYFVGHSLGSIVIRHYLAAYHPRRAVRVVMIAPPNHGSRAADLVDKTPLYRIIWGRKAGFELRSSQKDFWKKLPPPPIEFGILAGGRGTPRGFNPFIPGDDDGTVSVEEARLDGAKDFLILPYQHTGIVFRRRTAEATVRFLETGSFKDRTDSSSTGRAGSPK